MTPICGKGKRFTVLVAGLENSHRNKARNDGGESRSNGEHNQAISLPLFAEAGSLSEDVHNIGSAVRDICDDSKQKQTEAEIEGKHFPG
jgi:hypothetical protein